MPPSEPLFSRGWALQERAVSTHIAHFTRQELVWEYTASLRCDCGGPGIDETSFMGSPKKQMHEGQIKTYQQEISYATIKWEIIVKAYTQRHYTKPEDQAAAFMGTEQRFGNIVGSENVEMIGEFCAGLWSTYLPSSLLWSCSIDSFLDLPGKSRGRMIRDSETPSWSWYSVIGQSTRSTTNDDVAIMTDLEQKSNARAVYLLADDLDGERTVGEIYCFCLCTSYHIDPCPDGYSFIGTI
ncbi:hypothetical protein E0Z10_g8988 [Xylaria hypoxylon]|uniref:Heterokaryon incompatibility domain-containing protein n=1 Tax=Xylaria hypoxylon TaxID=37992 RepID=A0A4Z0YIE4_9PEZI|nr:hypothetical protein E0Z10_g8988 [Xylaria hypoxylon]